MPQLRLNPYTFRLFSFWGMVNLLSGFGTLFYYEFLKFRQFNGIDALLLFTFSLLFLHLSYGFSIALFGFFQYIRGGDRLRCNLSENSLLDVSLEKVSIAVVVPIYNENSFEVYERISQMYLGLKELPEFTSFDFFILSDSNKIPLWLQEESEFILLMKKTQGWGRIYYRRRKSNTNGKSGNISDFCRRYGKNYRYMLVLDADSYMHPKGMVLLAKKMEAEPTLGILQSNPLIYKEQTSFQRLFSNSQRLYSSYYLNGANYWQMNSSSFWGHNAIIRLEPFMDHCALPKLPKLGALGGKILSHDTIEAALIRRAGYSVQFTTDDIGSYEEYPPSWVDSLQRDQRWCQGNLQHFWFLGAKELNFQSKVSITLGIFSYLSSVMWLIFIVLSLILYLNDLRFFRLSFNSKDFELIFQEFYIMKAIILQWVTLALLFLPKIIAFLIEFFHPRRLGTSRRNIFGFFLKENLISFLMAPTNMFMHVKFVMYTLFGKKVIWNNQNRNSQSRMSFNFAFSNFKYPFIFGIVSAIFLYDLDLNLFFWISPIWFSWIISPILAYLTSSPLKNIYNSKKLLFRNSSKFENISETSQLQISSISENSLKINTIKAMKLLLTDPYYFSIHLIMTRDRLLETDKTKSSLKNLVHLLISSDPVTLKEKSIHRILNNKTSLLYFHEIFWKTEPKDRHPFWN
jgi:membrane glycosyltransferase